MTRSLQATLPGRSIQIPSTGNGIAAAIAALVRGVQGWLAAPRDMRVPAHARDSVRAQRLMRSW